MSAFLDVTKGIAGRTLRTAFRNPALLMPPLIAPLIFFAVFGGGLQTLGSAPGFDYPAGYTSFAFVFILLNSASFNGVFSGFSLAQDFEKGFARRLLVASPRRSGIVGGYVVSALVRAALGIALLFAVGTAIGMEVDGSAIEIAGVVTMGLGFGVLASLWAIGLAFRLRTMQAAPAMQIPLFLGLFFAPAFVPLALLTGWLHDVAVYNPVTYLLQAGRGFIAGQPTDLGLAWGVLGVLIPLFTLWAMRGLRAAERAG